MFICTDKTKADEAFEAKAPRDVIDIVRETYPGCTIDANGRGHAPCDGYECPVTGQIFRAGEFLPVHGEAGGCAWTVEAVDGITGLVVDWIGSPAQIKAVREILKEQNAEYDRQRSKYVGTIGEKIAFTAEVQVSLDFLGVYGTSYIIIMREVDKGNIFVYRGSKYLGKRGSVITVAGKIKAHGEYNSVAQTTIERPKLL